MTPAEVRAVIAELKAAAAEGECVAARLSFSHDRTRLEGEGGGYRSSAGILAVALAASEGSK